MKVILAFFLLVASIFPLPPALPSPAASHLAQSPLSGEMDCTAPCNPDVFASGSGNWLIHSPGANPGKGTDPYCVTCKPCSVRIHAAYIATGQWQWSDQGGDGGTGSGQTSMAWSSSTGCNGTPEHLFLNSQDGGVQIVALYCYCNF